MSSSELTEWLAFAELEPFGGAVDDLRAGLAPSMTLNTNLGNEGEPVGPLHFYPWHNPELRKAAEPVREPTPEELAARIKVEVFGIQPDETTE